MNKNIKALAVAVLSAPLLYGIPRMASAEPIQVCGYALFGIGAAVYLANGYDKKADPHSHSGYIYNCSGVTTNSVPVGQQTNIVTINRGDNLYVCYGGQTDPSSSIKANQPGMYGVQGNLIAGFSITWHGPSDGHSDWVCK